MAQGLNPRADDAPTPTLNITNAVYPQFSTAQSRLATFRNWPQGLARSVPASDIVTIGFYYAGYADCMRCFYCGLGLKSWYEEDDALIPLIHIDNAPSPNQQENAVDQSDRHRPAKCPGGGTEVDVGVSDQHPEQRDLLGIGGSTCQKLMLIMIQEEGRCRRRYTQCLHFQQTSKNKEQSETDLPDCYRYLFFFRPQVGETYVLPVQFMTNSYPCEIWPMRCELNRFGSFHYSPLFHRGELPNSPFHLARDGYWYNTDTDRIECYYCHQGLGCQLAGFCYWMDANVPVNSLATPLTLRDSLQMMNVTPRLQPQGNPLAISAAGQQPLQNNGGQCRVCRQLEATVIFLCCNLALTCIACDRGTRACPQCQLVR